MNQKTLKLFSLAAAMMAIATTSALAALPAPDIMSVHRTALNVIVQPGVIIWWLLLAGPYQFFPTTVAAREEALHHDPGQGQAGHGGDGQA
jgi:hypothetical protein